MGALLDQFRAVGVLFEAEADKLRAHGTLTDELRAAIRAQKPTILAELAAANGARLTLPPDAGKSTPRTTIRWK